MCLWSISIRIDWSSSSLVITSPAPVASPIAEPHATDDIAETLIAAKTNKYLMLFIR